MRRGFLVAEVTLVSFALLASAASAADVSAARQAAATHLVEVLGLEDQFQASLPMIADVAILQSPKVAPYRDVITQWANTYITWKSIRPRVIDLYAQTFTEPEMQELATFYATPTGRKAITTMPLLMQRSLAMGNELAREHGDDLVRMMREQDARQGKGGRESKDERPAGSPATAPQPTDDPAESDHPMGTDQAHRETDQAQRESVGSLRDVGTAMMSWQTDMVSEPDWQPVAENAPPDGKNWSQCPRISYEGLSALLSPIYMVNVPRKDGWGNALEFCLDPTARREHFVLGVRSAGRDGRFESSDYVQGEFAASELDRDIVWLDGSFLSRPRR